MGWELHLKVSNTRRQNTVFLSFHVFFGYYILIVSVNSNLNRDILSNVILSLHILTIPVEHQLSRYLYLKKILEGQLKRSETSIHQSLIISDPDK